jgi:putative ABC transport system permease protein
MLVSPGYFRLLGIPVRSGRDFGERDVAEAPLTCIVNAALARDAFPDDDPIGQRIETGYDSVPDGAHLMTIVGVVGDVRQYDPKTPPEPIIYMPYQQHPLPATEMKVLFRAPGDPSAAMTALRAEAKRLNPEVPTSFLPLVRTLETALAPSRFRTLLLALFAGLAGVLAIVGLYGVMSYSVSQRTREIGMRIALGAAPGRIVGMVLGQGLRLVLPGVVAGVALSLAAGRMVTSFVYGIRPSDPITLLVVSVLLAGVAVASMAIPARRAARVDPLVALRQE